jgi:thiamine-phosphate pyrophosphorylase
MDASALRLVAIADTLRDGLDELVARAVSAAECGATSVHLRLRGEDARTMLDASRGLVAALRVPLIVHDRADVAVAAGAAGVHLSLDELSPQVVRRLIPSNMTIGASAGSSAELEEVAGADYVSIGPVFARASHGSGGIALGVDELTRLVRGAELPVVAVGGVTAANARSVLDAGATGVAVITGAFGKAEAEQAIRELRAAIES